MDNEVNKAIPGNLGSKFRTCPHCGELSIAETPDCRFCGFNFVTQTIAVTTNPVGSVQPPYDRNHPTSKPPGFSAPPVTKITCTTTVGHVKVVPLQPIPSALHTPNGYKIPPEYTEALHPECFCWAAFWFADLWFADKGFVDRAWRHFRYRMVTSVIGISVIILSVYLGVQGDVSTTSSAAMGILALAWLASLLVTIGLSHSDARIALRDYIEFESRADSDEKEQKCQEGRRAYWVMLLVPFGLFLFSYMVMLIVVHGMGY
jgi:hypothetical protein